MTTYQAETGMETSATHWADVTMPDETKVDAKGKSSWRRS